MLSLSVRMGIPISFLSRGQRIPEDLEAASVNVLLDLILKSEAGRRAELRSGGGMSAQLTVKEPARAVKKYQSAGQRRRRPRAPDSRTPAAGAADCAAHSRAAAGKRKPGRPDLHRHARLIAAIDRFDPSHNVKLKTYAEYKIRGAILDSLRGLDWAPRQQRKRSKQIEAAIAVAEQRLHRAPTEDEIAAQLRADAGGVSRVAGGYPRRQHRKPGSSSPEGDGRSLLKYISDDEENWPSRLLEKSELQRLLADAIEKMPPTERIVISLYYHEELTLREIAKVVDLHESRVSQLKSQAILRLRSYLEKRWPLERGA